MELSENRTSKLYFSRSLSGTFLLPSIQARRRLSFFPLGARENERRELFWSFSHGSISICKQCGLVIAHKKQASKCDDPSFLDITQSFYSHVIDQDFLIQKHSMRLGGFFFFPFASFSRTKKHPPHSHEKRDQVIN
jgi:hypothetical protein